MIRREAPAHPSGGTGATPESPPKGCDDGSAPRKRMRKERSLPQRCGRRARRHGCLTARGRTSKGNKAQGRTGRFTAGNGRGSKPDLTAEQSLEVEEPAERPSNLEPATEPGRDGEAGGDDGKGATATAMWCGCGAGDSSKGVNNVVRSASHHETRRTSQLAAG